MRMLGDKILLWQQGERINSMPLCLHKEKNLGRNLENVIGNCLTPLMYFLFPVSLHEGDNISSSRQPSEDSSFTRNVFGSH